MPLSWEGVREPEWGNATQTPSLAKSVSILRTILWKALHAVKLSKETERVSASMSYDITIILLMGAVWVAFLLRALLKRYVRLI